MKYIIITLVLTSLSCNYRDPAAKSFRAANSSALGMPANTSMSFGYIPTLNAITINKSDVEELRKRTIGCCSFFNHFKYMGTKSEFHYFMYYQTLSFKKMYRVNKKEYHIEKEINLTVDQQKWQEQFDRNYLNLHAQNLDIINLTTEPNLKFQQYLIGANVFENPQ